MRMCRLFLIPTLVAAPLLAQTPPPTDPIYDELRALLDAPVTVASKRATTVREAPGVITLVTRQEILASGARDLIDVLRMVPGLDLASDVQGVVGLAMRGSWGYEGKLLLLWDGLEMNETLYGTTQFGNHYPVDQIKQIEVIRGPGSSIYGGYAELGVIKVTTLGADDLKQGGIATIMQGSGADASFHQQFSVVAGGGENLKLSLGAFLGRGQRSDQDLTDASGSTYNLKGNSDLRPLFFNLGADWNGLSLRYVADRYATTQQDYLGLTTASPYPLNFRSDNVEIKYQWQLGDALTLTPRYAYRSQQPWQTLDTRIDPVAGSEFFRVKAIRQKSGLDLAWDASPNLNLLAGLERIQDDARNLDLAYGTAFTSTGGNTVAYGTSAAYAQGTWSGSWANLTVGARWENNSYSGSAFVPRVALTKVAGVWHFKALFAKAFKPPTIENINLNTDPGVPIVPETTRTLEVEMGRQLGNGLLTVNVFEVSIDRPIVYFVDGNGLQGYANFDHSGTRGVEIEYKLKTTWGYLNATQSLSQARNNVLRYTVPGHADTLLGLASSKTTLGSSLNLGGNWSLAPTLVYSGQRYGYVFSQAAGDPALQRFGPDTLINLNLTGHFGPFNASLGVFDLLNQNPPFLQPYAAGHAPLPGPSRELVAKLGYSF